jgi:hypothetical protein
MLADQKSANEVVIACNPNAIPADQGEQHEAAVRVLFAAVQSVKALPDGYAFRLPTTSAMVLGAAEFIANERLCCPFFNFALEAEPNAGPIWLRLTGGEGVKELIKTEFSAVLDPAVMEAGSLQA